MPGAGTIATAQRHLKNCVRLFPRGARMGLLDTPEAGRGEDELPVSSQATAGDGGPGSGTKGKEAIKEGAGTMVKSVAFAGQVLLTCSVALITQASKRGGASYTYNTLTVPFFSEVLKLLLSVALLTRECLSSSSPPFRFSVRNLLAASVPALLYLITNNFNFIIIHEIGALSFQILNNFKIVTAAILFQIIMRRQLTPLQWRGILLLTVGSLLSQLKDCSTGGFAMTGTAKGYLLKTVNCTLTSFAGVYCEKFLKHTSDSIHYQNLQLYFWGTLFASTSLVVSGSSSGGGLQELWRGQNLYSVSLIFNYAFVGLATAFVLKYLDNIAKNFAAVTAMFVAALAANVLFQEPLTIHLAIGLAVAGMAADLYVRHNRLAPSP
uniref:Cmp-sialic acid transporter 1-like n=1 Tax=Tetraselmis sp. GSL018 TaxID=582737 RepID=A0A061SCW7_9CHLO|mmetsp:Transcript_29651/g.70684  ORF Transcript_29651/g.70684 Transcript_29651/m.70684 type:complete len:380 (-) Transcript_29651:40-1179(-)|eukprot:CAMPEP_0177585216 /NCGR_PEP_ID=MMETSP0419_2-20121207/4356_1 /TAXON_ID=582737 /ORGANISM="Tetraselmis sp., Strain GSL018" /LENGTH=379 /DNA_ID=CAMNT_0019074897 /DNA_START=342 /DNA_END=1481 /DNA_ORIENTATION=-